MPTLTGMFWMSTGSRGEGPGTHRRTGPWAHKSAVAQLRHPAFRAGGLSCGRCRGRRCQRLIELSDLICLVARADGTKGLRQAGGRRRSVTAGGALPVLVNSSPMASPCGPRDGWQAQAQRGLTPPNPRRSASIRHRWPPVLGPVGRPLPCLVRGRWSGRTRSRHGRLPAGPRGR